MNEYVSCSFCTVAIGVDVSIGPTNLHMGKDVNLIVSDTNRKERISFKEIFKYWCINFVKRKKCVLLISKIDVTIYITGLEKENRRSWAGISC